MNVAIITLFPEMFDAITQYGITSRALKDGLVSLCCLNPRDYTTDKHQTVDDRPYGGGPGMVMKVEPLKKALDAALDWHAQIAAGIDESREPPTVIYMSPQGKVLRHSDVDATAAQRNMIIIAGRYEGIDQRFIDNYIDEQWSIGDFVLSGGELPCMVMLDAMIRKLPGAMGASESHEQDSFENGLLDCPHYTRPVSLVGLACIEPATQQNKEKCDVPHVLLSGNHSAIAQWRREQSLLATANARPDLLDGKTLTKDDQKVLANK